MNWYDVISIITYVINHLLWLGGSQAKPVGREPRRRQKRNLLTILGDKYFF